MRPLVAIFAHPDDEAFGPAGTLALQAKKRDVYIICVTNGEAGKNSNKKSNRSLPDIRRKELHNSAKILGIKRVYFLGYEDGMLCNNIYHGLARKIEKKLAQIKPDTVMTFEPRGVSGHIDHITVSMVTTFVFRKLPFAKILLYYCIDEREGNEFRSDYFIYFPPGYKKDQIDKTVDISSVWKTKISAMMAHESQKHDAQTILKFTQKRPKDEHFLVVKK